jgi:hypothetical protein
VSPRINNVTVRSSVLRGSKVTLDSVSSDNVVIAAAFTNTRDLYGAGGIVNEGANNLILSPGGAAPAPTPWPIIAAVVGRSSLCWSDG